MEKIKEVYGKIRKVCIYATWAITAGLILLIIGQNSDALSGIGAFLVLLGYLCGLISGPWKWIKCFAKNVVAWFETGWNLIPIFPACLIGAFVAGGLALLIFGVYVLFLPAIEGMRVLAAEAELKEIANTINERTNEV